MSNCTGKRIQGPSGVWEYDQLLGAKVRLKSMPISNFFSCQGGVSEVFTIKDITFRISLDGKTITIIELSEMPGKVFTWKDLEVIDIAVTAKFKALCGTFCAAQTLCGYKVSGEPSYLEGITGGVAVVDDMGNIISGRYIRFVGADVEDLGTDTDEVTDIDINISGDVLD